MSSPGSSSSLKNIVYITDTPVPTTPQPTFDYHSLDGSEQAICSHSWRAGFSSMSTPHVDRLNVIARYKERKLGKNIVLFGKDVEADANSRSNVRQMFDGDLLIHGDLLECALDFTFSSLGLDTDRVQHPIIMTERLANPLFTRGMTSELLFEMYGAPSVTFGIDSLFAFSRQRHQDGLSISLGHNATTVIPISSTMLMSYRLPWGGARAAELMLKLAQLKYPAFPVKVTLPQATFMYRETCYFSSSYEEELRSLEDPEKLAAMTTIVQFPYNQPDVVEKTEAELAAAADRRREQGKRLQDMQSKMRAEKLTAKINELEEYKSLLAQRPTMKKSDFLDQIAETTPFDTEAELEVWVKRTEAEVKKKQKKDMGEEVEEEQPVFPLADRPDEELTEEEIKEKRRQRLMRAGYEARVKIREEKRLEKERQDEERRKEEEERLSDPAGWAARLRAEQDAVIVRMEERKKRRSQMSNRKSAAAQNRMKTLANLAADTPPSKKRKKGEVDDGFGRDDSDWAVYREMDGEDESEAEEEDQTLLESLESRLLQHDPSFTEDETMQGRAHTKNALINAFVRGATSHRFDPSNPEQSHQLHLNVERIRVPETWFQPSMFGIDSAGIGEIAGWVLNGFEEEQRRRMMQCIFLTGGCTNLPNLSTRMRNTLTPLLPFRAPLKIVTSLDDGNPQLEAYRGMTEWALSEEAKKSRVTKAEYEEHGGEWLKEHSWGNIPPS
ncbi:hypothetical protein TREMEDRAFT_59461 [Tremella mesenterica DSM 1558]|uniref:uncharacterized protein n=1 Tax=Tremella mesenterica (strain ATCC 24925 / CBS 8224 / DSM 1558 / NBRC 9311 / NRRL Y-6157 / RJB 2259-6 / UBC 559-6) TaxID=578456 RepID=UPI0003F4A262|nr:uncharacterized protein TREMEDRAFT_59461 [Tremella mesenterica DSM 1558]EIW73296.1 hypothetical protein TREMEDRAFT_59461 [Tremella mesenterica DSM 1558]